METLVFILCSVIIWIAGVTGGYFLCKRRHAKTELKWEHEGKPLGTIRGIDAGDEGIYFQLELEVMPEVLMQKDKACFKIKKVSTRE